MWQAVQTQSTNILYITGMSVHKEDSDVGAKLHSDGIATVGIQQTVTTVHILNMSLSNNYIHINNQHKREVIEVGPKGKRNYDQMNKESGWGKGGVKKGRRQRYDTYRVSHSLPNRLAGRPLLRVATIRRTTDTFLFISHTTNILLFKFLCNIFIGVRIIKEMLRSVASGTRCIKETWEGLMDKV